MKKVLLLGASGSIGSSTLKVLRKHSNRFELVGISCHSNAKLLLDLATEFHLKEASLSGENFSAQEISDIQSHAKKLGLKLYLGKEGIQELISHSEAEVVVNGIAGSAGFEPSIWALEAQKDLALANKETIVMGGDLVLTLATEQDCHILPVDSEHAAIFELLQGKQPEEIESLWITASGGAFRDRPFETFDQITLAEALNHPTWKMGKKITINSASMANKGLEVIEACRLFNMPPEKVHVVIQPTSQVHSLIRTLEGSFYAQLSNPDMALPILNALSWPQKIQSDLGQLDLLHLNLQFQEADMRKYPLLSLAYEAAKIGGDAPLIFNSANEAALDLFINEKISYLQMAPIVEKALKRATGKILSSVSEILALNSEIYKSIL